MQNLALGYLMFQVTRSAFWVGLIGFAQLFPLALLGLYSGGALAHEAATLLEPSLGPLAGNVGYGRPESDGGHALCWARRQALE